MTDSTAPAPQPPGTVVTYVGFGPRFAAFLVDSLLVLPLLIGFIVLLYQSQGNWLQIIIASQQNLWLNYGLPAGLTLLFWLIKSATPGKMFLNATIVDAVTLQKPTPGKLVLRYFGYYLSLLPLGLGFLWILLDPKKRGWHDLLAGTVVIEKPASNRA